MAITMIITGAGRGIGCEIALRGAKELLGMGRKVNLVLISRSRGAALNNTADAARALGASVLSLLGDIGDEIFLREIVHESAERFGGIDILINNAGSARISLLQDLKPEEITSFINANLSSHVILTSLALPYLLKSENSPRIINISSVWGNVGASCETVYSAAKGGINAFTKALAKELAPMGIPVNAVAFGLIDTEMNSHLSQQELEALCEDIPAGRPGSTEEAAEAVIALLKSSPYLTGQIITLDGGWT